MVNPTKLFKLTTAFILLFLVKTPLLYAQSGQSFEEFKKQEEQRFENFKEAERKRFEAFVKNETDWNAITLGTPHKPIISKKDTKKGEKTLDWDVYVPNYVDTSTTLKKEVKRLQFDENGEQLYYAKTNHPVKKVIKPQPKKESPKPIAKPITKPKPVVQKPNPIVLLPKGNPIKSPHRISSKFGPRTHPIYRKKSYHSGIDLACSKGTRIYVPAEGTVIRAGQSSGYGNYILIRHANGYETAYAHLSRILVKKGQRVTKDTIIGEVGSTGRSTGNHLHYEIIKDKKKINPSSFIS